MFKILTNQNILIFVKNVLLKLFSKLQRSGWERERWLSSQAGFVVVEIGDLQHQDILSMGLKFFTIRSLSVLIYTFSFY